MEHPEDSVSCRVCLSREVGNGNGILIFNTTTLSHKYRSISYADMMMACATVTISADDLYPKVLCRDCSRKLEEVYTFRKLCETSYDYFVRHYSKHCIKEEPDDAYDVGEDYPVKVACEWVKPEFKKSQYRKIQSDIDDPLIGRKSNSTKIKRKITKKSVFENERSAKIGGEKFIYQCSYCPKILSRRYKWRLHEDMHLGIKRYFCEICKNYFRHETEHKRMHRNKDKFKCDQCEKLFSSKQKLKAHSIVHVDNSEKNFTCEAEGCSRKYKSPLALYIHVRRNHSKQDNRFICDVCSKILGSNDSLKTHKATHMDVKQFRCTQCSKEFYTKNSLRHHQMVNHSNKSYKCAECSKEFKIKNLLARHMKLHQKYNEACRFCDKKFARLDYRKKHEVKEHSAEINAHSNTSVN